MRDYCSNACRQKAYRDRKRREREQERYELQVRNAALMNNAGIMMAGWLALGT